MITSTQPLSDSDKFKTHLELKSILVERIETLDKPDIYYSDLVALLQIDLAVDDRRFFELLDELSEKEFSQGRGFLSVVVIGKATNRPGDGFFDMAKRCGVDTRDREEFYASARRHVINHWK